MSHVDVDGVVGDVHLVVKIVDAVHVVVTVVVLETEIFINSPESKNCSCLSSKNYVLGLSH